MMKPRFAISVRSMFRDTSKTANLILKNFRRNVHLAVEQLDRVIDLNFYTIPSTKDSNNALAQHRTRSDGFAGRFLSDAARFRFR